MYTLEQQFGLKYSEIMEYFQCIECDLKRIYSAMSADDFDNNMDMLELPNMGKTLRELEDMDNCDGDPFLSEADYDTLDAIRELRNYRAHQCYLDWVYCHDNWKRNSKLQRVYNKLVYKWLAGRRRCSDSFSQVYTKDHNCSL